MVTPIGSMPADLANRLDRLDRAVRTAAPRTIRSAAAAAVREHETTMRQDSGGDMVLSRVGARKGRVGGRKIGARFRMTTAYGTDATAEVLASGPVPLVANPIPGHVIRSAYVRGAVRSSRGLSQAFGPAIGAISGGDRRAVLNIPGIGYRRSARHPGTRGKDTWNRAKPKARTAISREMGRETDRVVRTAFKG